MWMFMQWLGAAAAVGIIFGFVFGLPYFVGGFLEAVTTGNTPSEPESLNKFGFWSSYVGLAMLIAYQILKMYGVGA